jgi:tRNA(fMet)-specific endonuclease VapC
MKRYLLDSGPASDCINGRNGIRERVAAEKSKGHVVGVAYPVLAELLGGAAKARDPDRQSKLVMRGLAGLKLWPFDLDAVREYARVFAALDRIGRRIQQNDVQIAAIALTLSACTVVSYDSDLSALPGLSVENWLETTA